MRVIPALALVGLGIAFLFWGPWSARDPVDIEPPKPLPRPPHAGDPSHPPTPVGQVPKP